jgi:tryptophanyl-tRNA synthetase
MDFKINFVQLVIYSPGIVFINKLKMANEINDNLSNLLDDDPVMLPLPEDAPADIPIIQMSSKNKRYILSIAANRIDFIYQYKDENKGLFPALDFFEKFLTIFKYFAEKIHTQFTRSAMVTNWVIELGDISPAEFLRNKYIQKDTPIINPYELEIHYLTKGTIGKFEVNKWVRIKSEHKMSETEKNSLITFLIDINTVEEKIYEFDMDSLQSFLEQSSNITKETISEHLKKIGE